MSDFQISLIILGALFLVAVWLVNKAQERRVQRSIEQRFGANRGDALLDGAARGANKDQRTEPTLTPLDDVSSAAALDADEQDGDGRHEPGMTEAADAAGANVPQIMIDDDIHVSILLAADQAVSGERILGLLHDLRRAGRQTVTIVGTHGGTPGEESWGPIRAGGRYDTILIAVQLANRSGPLNEIEFSEFVAAVQHVADQIPASCDVPDMMETMARARALDARCAQLDAQVGINLVQPAGRWSGDLIARLLSDHQMSLRADGRFHAVDEQGGSAFTLQNGDGEGFRADTLSQMSTQRLTLLLDVPQAARDEANPAADPFQRMVTVAQALAEQLGGVLVDDNMRALTPSALAAIEEQIKPAYARLEEAGMRAGSPRALALFS